MKYLKSFNESLEPNIKQDLEDICQELKDEGFTIKIDVGKTTTYPPFAEYLITLYKISESGSDRTGRYKWFTYKFIEDVFLRMQDYTDQQGYDAKIKLHPVNWTPFGGQWGSKVKIEEEQESCDFIWIKIDKKSDMKPHNENIIPFPNDEIIQKLTTDNRISDEIQQEIIEICYELNDIGLTCEFITRISQGKTVIYLNDSELRQLKHSFFKATGEINMSSHLAIYVDYDEDFQDDIGNDKGSFDTKDVEETLLRIQDYLKGIGYACIIFYDWRSKPKERCFEILVSIEKINNLKLNESLEPNTIQDLQDICQELQDIGFEITINEDLYWVEIWRKHSPYDVPEEIKKNYFASTALFNYFSYESIKETIERIKDYMNQQGYKSRETQFKNIHVFPDNSYLYAVRISFLFKYILAN